MAKKPDEWFTLPKPAMAELTILNLLGGGSGKRILSGQEALVEEARIKAAAKKGDLACRVAYAKRLLIECSRFNREALQHLKYAVKAEHPEGLYLYGLCWMRGQGVKKNPQEGVRFLERAALRGHALAQRDLAKAYQIGAGVAADAAKAVYWWRLGAGNQDAFCAYQVGLAYYRGEGVELDYEQAQKWLTQAAQKGVIEAQKTLCQLHLDRAYEKRDAREVRRWMKEVALSGDAQAQFKMGIYAWSGFGGPVNSREAIRWLIHASASGSVDATYMLAGFFQTGNALPLNRLSAWYLYERMYERGDKRQHANLKALRKTLKLAQRKSLRIYYSSRSMREILEDLIPKSYR